MIAELSRIDVDLNRPKYRLEIVLHIVPNVLSREHNSINVLGSDRQTDLSREGSPPHMPTKEFEKMSCAESTMSGPNRQAKLATLPILNRSRRSLGFISMPRARTSEGMLSGPGALLLRRDRTAAISSSSRKTRKAPSPTPELVFYYVRLHSRAIMNTR
ncbi:hypothetical protein J6590_051023 [Homalodisca vitripennis]|nr:hypothetical protein J6590_051023 [Homalodisca vitripennis]